MHRPFNVRAYAVAGLFIAFLGGSADAASVVKAGRHSTMPVQQKAEPAQCIKLNSDYEDASKKLARSKSEDVMDNSAIRSNMRNSENGNTIAQARMTFDIMKGLGCKLPDHTPSASRYSLQSMRCTVALQRQRTKNALARLNDTSPSFERPNECDTSLWAYTP